MNALEMIPIGVVTTATAFAAFTDIRKFKVYNALTLPLLMSGILFRTITDGWVGLGDSLLGATFGLLSLLVFYIMGGMGAGDVKLMAAVGAWLGMPLTFHVFLAASLAAGVYAVVLLIINHGIAETLVYIELSFHRLSTLGRRIGLEPQLEKEAVRDDRHRRLIPFAAMIFLGLCTALLRNRYMH